MREILFRGKRIDNGEWVEGCYFNSISENLPPQIRYYIKPEKTEPVLISVDVLPETIGQYTGLTDINGIKIFEGDILKNGNDIGVVTANTCNCSCCHCVYGFSICDSEGIPIDDMHFVDSEKIGNIHDNPELLKGGV